MFEVSEKAKLYLQKNVRVEREAAKHFQFYGISGLVSAFHESKDGSETVSIISESDGAFQVPLELVELRRPRECETRPYFNFARVSVVAKTLMLHQMGIWHYENAATIEPVTQKAPAQLEGHHIRLWNVVLSQTFPEAKCYLVDPVSVLSQLFDESTPKETQERLLRGISNAFSSPSFRKLLFPVHCPPCEDHKMGHWTLLVIDKANKDQPAIRYIDTLNDLNEICFSKALRILSWLGLPQEDAKRTNEARQSEAECTEQVMYYMELEFRQQMGEGWGSLRCFKAHRKTIRTLLGRFAQNLELHRVEYVKTAKDDEIKSQVVKKFLEQQIGKAQTFQIEIDKLAKLAQEVAQLNAAKHLGLPNLELPKPAPRPQPKKKESQGVKPAIKPKKTAAAEQEKKADEPAPQPPTEEPLEEPALPSEPPAAQPPAVVHVSDEEDEGIIQEKLAELAKGEVKFAAWLISLTIEQKAQITQHCYEKHEHWSAFQKYIAKVKASETIKVCAKCHWTTGCERCDSDKSYNFLLRHAKLPAWFQRLKTC